MAKEIADKAIAQRRLHRVMLERDKVEGTPMLERDWMEELDHGRLFGDISLCEPSDGQIAV